MTISLSLVVILLTVMAVLKGVDVRLALLLAAVALGLLGGNPAAIMRTFLATLVNEQFVVPICTAMGFAHVLRRTGCDQHLVHLLVKPLERVRFLVLPGAVLIGFFVNIPIISQTSTAVAVGSVLIPLLLAARIGSVTTGAALLLGASMGGELLNPGAPELRTIATALSIPSTDCVRHVLPLLAVQMCVATALFWILSVRAERQFPAKVAETPGEEFHVQPLKALIPLVPLVLLFLSGGPFYLLQVPHDWLIDTAKASEEQLFDGRLIGAAMLVGVVAAIAVTPSAIPDCTKSFFDGAGYAYAHIISLIVVARCFGTGIEQVGLADVLGQVTARSPGLLVPSAAGLPLAFGWLSGSGMAATQSLYGFFVEPARAVGVPAVDLGALVAIAAAAGRTLSPVSAVTLMCASMTQTNPIALCKRLAIPLLVGLACVLVTALFMFRHT
ncbi:MAG TPA: C4-dicarboxylate transporter DcuC [Gemmataceae bacterium]|jgi:DcuC family C4-dicarboxylate transporter|nr:C4-dicarboxylate transporter DcuC [Gemmataceae bacterium]